MAVTHDAMVIRAKLLASTVQSLQRDENIGIKQAIKQVQHLALPHTQTSCMPQVAMESSGALREDERWWLWRLRCDRGFIFNYLTKHHPSFMATPFCKTLKDIVFSNELKASYPQTTTSDATQTSSNRYAAILAKHTQNNNQDVNSRVEVVPADCDDIEAVRKLTDRCVMAVRGKYRGRSGYIVGAGKGCYIVSIDGEECQIKGSHLELQHEDYGSSEEQEADVIQVPASGEDDDQEADGSDATPTRTLTCAQRMIG